MAYTYILLKNSLLFWFQTCLQPCAPRLLPIAGSREMLSDSLWKTVTRIF